MSDFDLFDNNDDLGHTPTNELPSTSNNLDQGYPKEWFAQDIPANPFQPTPDELMDRTQELGVALPRLELGATGFSHYQSADDLIHDIHQYSISGTELKATEAKGETGIVFLMEQTVKAVSNKIDGYEKLESILKVNINIDKLKTAITDMKEHLAQNGIHEDSAMFLGTHHLIAFQFVRQISEHFQPRA